MASLNLVQVFDVSLYAETFFRAKPLALVKLETLPNWLDVWGMYIVDMIWDIRIILKPSRQHRWNTL